MSCAGHQQERAHRGGVTGAPPGVALGQPRDDTIGDQRVATKTAVGQPRPMGLGAHPPGEAVWPERVGVEVTPHRGRVDDALVVVGGQWCTGRGVFQIGVRDVPLAVVVSVIPGRAKPVTQRRHLAGP